MNGVDQAEHALFLVKWWKEFWLGLSAFLGIVIIVRKGQKVPVTVTLTAQQIDEKMQLCRHELKDEIHDDIRQIMHDHKEDMLRQIDLMIQASTNR